MTNKEASKLIPLCSGVYYFTHDKRKMVGMVLGLKESESGDIIVNALYSDENDEDFSRTYNCAYLSKI